MKEEHCRLRVEDKELVWSETYIIDNKNVPRTLTINFILLSFLPLINLRQKLFKCKGER